MAEVPRAPLGRPPAASWLPRVAAAFVIFVVLAIVKPWTPPSTAVAPNAPPTFYIAPLATERTGPRPYDPRLFGGREPEPAWELWPAGYVVMFGMAGPVRVAGDDLPTTEPGASGGPAASGGSVLPSPAASGGAQSGPTMPRLTPGVIDLGPADHLVALGINSPLDARVTDVTLSFYRGENCCLEELPIVRLPTLWESSHFIVIAPADPEEPGRAVAWLPGLYRLDVTTASGEVRAVTFAVLPPQG